MMKGLYMSKRLQMFLGVAVLTGAGCGMEPPPNMTPRVNDLPKTEANASQPLERVRRITAELMGVDVNRVNADTTLADLGADELDLVELTMELEEAFSTTIPDEALEKLAGEGDWETGMKKITIQKLADTVERQSRTQPK